MESNLNDFLPGMHVIEKLQSVGIEKSFHPGDVILRENAYIRSIPLVMKGAIRVMRSHDDGREILLYYIRAGESCIMSFLGGLHNDTSKVTAIAEEPTDILFVPVDKIMQLMKEDATWTDYFFRLYHKRFEELLEAVNAIAFKKLDERLLDLIEKKVELSGNKQLAITHEQIATELGTSRVVISRLLKQLEDDGQVKLERNRITWLG
ncbi:MAG: Crp/Fnr family transcriptional regulator [Chitinophagaceae bacterium]|nr:Crp/Fnr family transcriptional regulator [Chitinophagaceae bacterium]